MRGIVVDENVVMEAIEGRKPSGDHALSEGAFVFKLLGSDNPVFVNSPIIKKYHGIERKIIARSHSKRINESLYVALMQTLANSHRMHHVDGVAVDWPGLKKCDKEFAGVALQSGSILVTGDTRLRELLARHPVGSGIECVTAKRALGMQSAWG